MGYINKIMIDFYIIIMIITNIKYVNNSMIQKNKKEVFKHKIPATLIFITYSPVPLLFVA